MMEGITLRVDRVSRAFGALLAVDGVSLAIAEGEKHAILGPNGSGKTTLFNLISGDLPLTKGKVFLGQKDISDYPVYRRIRHGIRRTYQNTLLFSGLTVFENLLLSVRGILPERYSLRTVRTSSEAGDEVRRIAALLRIEDLLPESVADLSHGNQKLIEIGMALAGDARVILLDEPVAGLSHEDRALIPRVLSDLPESITLVMIEHDMNVALQFAEYVTVLHNGKAIRERVTVDQIKQDQYIQELYVGGQGTHA
ncbi:MAG: ATP-binding cassette domain-containing protein [Spirochaetaceae bacterium]|nr:MAG: ATP-binding cassette domain-containing protein [Spirochaetaceae bacterium]